MGTLSAMLINHEMGPVAGKPVPETETMME
jgi:hypothetical protein